MIENVTDQETIFELVDGKPPLIFQMPTIKQLKEPEQDFKPTKNPRFADRRRHRNVQEPYELDSSRSNRTRKKKEEQIKQSKLLSQINDDVNQITRLNNRLKAYDEMRSLKYNQLQQEQEEFFFKPLQARITKAMSKDKYEKYLKYKEETIRESDKNPVPIRSPLPPNKVPTIIVSRKGIQDPHTRYKERQRKEERLERIINEAHGIEPPPKQKPYESGFDPGYYTRVLTTRFYTGRQEDAMLHGKRLFPQKFNDSINGNICTIKY